VEYFVQEMYYIILYYNFSYTN